ncbi:MAG: YitT family protein [Erysipelotrichales bacterium]|nr:YitT family protein [Erysipelotrichales bacterium]
MKTIDYDNIINQVTKRNRISRLIVLLIGAFIAGLVYNAFVVPNNVVYGGVGGIAIIVSKTTGIDTTLFINLVTIILTIISIFILGFKKTLYTIVGYLAYIIMVNLTIPIAPYFSFQFESYLLTVVLYSIIGGLGFGLIYKCGFNTGGMDSVIYIFQKYFPVPTSELSNILNGIIIVAGALTFGIIRSIYAIVYLKLQNFISNRTILGVSNNKLCFIKSNNIKEIEDLLTNDLEIGYTLIESTNGIGILKRNIIMCVVPSDRFYDLKQELLSIDKKSEIISNDCYTVVGGHVNKLINVNI